MNKTELLTALEGKYHVVLTPSHQRTEGAIAKYLVGCYDKAGENLSRLNLAFYVENEGEGGEVAYWAQFEPKPAPPIPVASFASEVQAYITTKITDDVIEGAFIESISEASETAVAVGYLVVAGSLVSRRIFIDKDGETIQHRAVTE